MPEENKAVNATAPAAEGQQPPVVNAPVASTESIEDLKARVQSLTQEKERLESGYKGLQRTHEKTQEELRRVSDLRSEIASVKDTLKIHATILAEQGTATEDETPEQRQQRLKKYQDLERDLDAKQKAEAYRKQADEVWAATQKFGTIEDNDDVLSIYEHLSSGRLDVAQARLKRLEKKQATPVVAPVEEKNQVAEVKPETPKKKVWDEMSEEEQDKIVHDRMVAKGLLQAEPGHPAGATSDFARTEQDYADGKISTTEYRKALTARGL
jgi:chromosome segregation ATPase